MEVKIGVRDIAGQVVLESESSPDDVAKDVREAVTSGSVLELTDEKGRLIMVPGSLIGYVEIGPQIERRVGFGTV
ncbi:MAG: hypothetical protein QG622_1588 [Actinomycetota bacterium]|nr:hypothetical protein [Actinomycetota bacterium]